MSTPPKAPCYSCNGTGIDPIVGFLDCEVCTPAPTGVSLSAPEQHLAKERRVILQADRVMRVYIAGPMTGLPEFNFPAFNAMAEVLRADGWHVENPAEHGHVDGAEWADYLRYDISRLSTCSAMMLLPGWSSSRGARLEVSIAKELGHEMLYAVGAEQMSSDFDRVTAERDALQQLLNAKDERADLLEGLLREVVALDPRGEFLGWQLDGKIDAALKPVEAQQCQFPQACPSNCGCDIPDFTPGNGNRARRRAESLGLTIPAAPTAYDGFDNGVD